MFYFLKDHNVIYTLEFVSPKDQLTNVFFKLLSEKRFIEIKKELKLIKI